ncbi:MAG: hypothetical protein N2653_12240 [Burkholderiales bacterium]|nr:hypothetical protein [Burkholderiales bacterium]
MSMVAAMPLVVVTGRRRSPFPRTLPPAPIVERANRALRSVLAREDVRRQMSNAGFEASEGSTPEALGAHIRAEIARWGSVRQRAGIAQE